MPGPRTLTQRGAGRRAFTLVEMLVSVALVLLMMSLFAQVFQLATGALATQRGIAENDQRARMLTTVLLNDLRNRSYRPINGEAGIRALYPNEDLSKFASLPKGYFYISENEPSDDSDDVLQFTVDVSSTSDPQSWYSGKAAQLIGGGGGLPGDANQPEADDQQLYLADDTALSQFAEVAYFFRNGNLYRRVLLIRNPVYGTIVQPMDLGSKDFFDPLSPNHYPTAAPTANPNGMFWADFDFSAVNGDPSFSTSPTSGARFVSTDTQEDKFKVLNPLYVGLPQNRFGHSRDVNNKNTYGMPREFGQLNDRTTYLGRLTQQETSDPAFLWPQGVLTSGGSVMGTKGNPFDPQDTPFSLDKGIIHWPPSPPAAAGTGYTFNNGKRAGEDLLLPNVHAFDIKVWDIKAAKFVDIGEVLDSVPPPVPADIENQLDYAAGTFPNNQPAVNGQLNSVYGPNTTIPNRVFDTWQTTIDLNQDGILESPPFRPVDYLPTSGKVSTWMPNNAYSSLQRVWPTNSNQLQTKYAYAYYWQAAMPGGTSGLIEPDWSIAGPVSDGSITWTPMLNVRPLRAIQITVRYLDPTSQQMRQVTLLHSFAP